MISIIIPLYNCKKFIQKTLDSLYCQTYRNFEIILINDNPNDDEFKYINDKDVTDIVIKKICNQNNLGLIKSLNIGIKISCGDYIICLGQDDKLSSSHLENCIRLMKPNIGMIYFNSMIIDENDTFTGTYFFKNRRDDRYINMNELFYNNTINSCGAILNKRIVIENGAYPENEKYPNFGEWLLWIRICNSSNIMYSNANVSMYRRHSTNMTKDVNEYNYYKIYRLYKIDCLRENLRLNKFCIKKTTYFYKYKYFSKLKLLLSQLRGVKK